MTMKRIRVIGGGTRAAPVRVAARIPVGQGFIANISFPEGTTEEQKACFWIQARNAFMVISAIDPELDSVRVGVEATYAADEGTLGRAQYYEVSYPCLGNIGRRAEGLITVCLPPCRSRCRESCEYATKVRRVFMHEFCHLSYHHLMRGRPTPMFCAEGFPEFVSLGIGGEAQALNDLILAGATFDYADLFVLDSDYVPLGPLHYKYYYLMMNYLGKAYGPETVVSFVHELAKASRWEDALMESFGITPQQLYAGFCRYFENHRSTWRPLDMGGAGDIFKEFRRWMGF